MDIITQLLPILKEGGALVILAVVLFKVSAALDRNTRALCRIEGKLGIVDTDTVELDATKKG